VVIETRRGSAATVRYSALVVRLPVRVPRALVARALGAYGGEAGFRLSWNFVSKRRGVVTLWRDLIDVVG